LVSIATNIVQVFSIHCVLVKELVNTATNIVQVFSIYCVLEGLDGKINCMETFNEKIRPILLNPSQLTI
jgi:hypothetical protein